MASNIVELVKIPRTNDPKEVDGFYKRVAELLNYQAYAGDPTGDIKPRFIGDKCLNTSTSKWYFANGLTVSDWEIAT